VLHLFRRHYPPCRHTSRRYRRCDCPIWVQGSLAGEWIKKSLGLTSWEAATDLVRGWEVGGGIGRHRREIPSVADAIDKFLVDAESRELKATSVRKYRHFLKKQLLPFAVSSRRTRLQQFDVEALRAFRASWKFKASTQQKKLETLRAFFRFCASAGWIEFNPAPAVKLPKVHQVPTLPFTEEDVAKLLKACERFRGDGSRLVPMILLLRHSGLRIGDAVGVRRDRITDGKLFLYTQKTGTPVRIPLPKDVCEALESLPEGDFLFWSGNGLLKSAIEDWRRRFKAVADLAHVKHAHFHRLRDSFAIGLLEKGVPIESVSVLLGHSDIKVTLKHYRPWVKSLQDKLEADVRMTWS
jgi:integrase/recombinase XerD